MISPEIQAILDPELAIAAETFTDCFLDLVKVFESRTGLRLDAVLALTLSLPCDAQRGSAPLTRRMRAVYTRETPLELRKGLLAALSAVALHPAPPVPVPPQNVPTGPVCRSRGRPGGRRRLC